MKFEERDIANCEGWSLAHSVKVGNKRLAKGTLLSAKTIDALQAEGQRAAQVFKLEPDDCDEDQATQIAAKLIAGSNVTVEPAGRGRANLLADCDGVFDPGGAIDFLNNLDDAFSAACKQPFARVCKGELIGTVKLIPYGLPKHILDAAQPKGKVSIAAFKPFTAQLIITGDQPTEKTLGILSARIQRVGGTLQQQTCVPHDGDAVKDALLNTTRADLILMLGASAISDMADTLPTGVKAAGGTIIKLGMPTDPGNLLMLAELNGKIVVGLPGCARSPAENGFDWILERYAAGLPLTRSSIAKMGTGGLLKEPAGRRTPRIEARPASAGTERTYAALVLAAGRSSRSGDSHKLLATLGEKTVIEATVDTILNASAIKPTLVTGARRADIEAAVEGWDITILHNENFMAGMGSSIALGARALIDTCDFAFICLGDMPFVQPSTYAALVQASETCPARSILVPTFNGKRGHPVLWGAGFFGDLAALTGDTGGKRLMQAHADAVLEVPVSDPGILIDLDTPEMLAHFGVTPAIISAINPAITPEDR